MNNISVKSYLFLSHFATAYRGLCIVKRCALSHTRTVALHAQKHTGTRKFLNIKFLPETQYSDYTMYVYMYVYRILERSSHKTEQSFCFDLGNVWKYWCIQKSFIMYSNFMHTLVLKRFLTTTKFARACPTQQQLMYAKWILAIEFILKKSRLMKQLITRLQRIKHLVI